MKRQNNEDASTYPLRKKLLLVASAPFQMRLGPTMRNLLTTKPKGTVGWINRTRDVALYALVLVFLGYLIDPEPLRLLVESLR